MLLGEWVSPRHIPIRGSEVGGEHVQWNSSNTFMASGKTKTRAKRPHIECDSDNDEPYPRFFILESKEQPPLTKTSPFVIEKSISALITPQTVKNLKNGTILMEVTEKKKQAEIILKQKKSTT